MRRALEVRLARIAYGVARPFVVLGDRFGGAERRRQDAETIRLWGEIRDTPHDYWFSHKPSATLNDDLMAEKIAALKVRKESEALDAWILAEARRIWNGLRA